MSSGISVGVHAAARAVSSELATAWALEEPVAPKSILARPDAKGCLPVLGVADA